MKIINKTKKQQTFKPITLEITIESEEELQALSHRFNSSYASLKKDIDLDYFNIDKFDYRNDCKTTTIWSMLNDIAEERNLLKDNR